MPTDARRVFSGLLSHAPLAPGGAQRRYEGMRSSETATEADDRAWLRDAGLAVVRAVDLSEEWTRILVDRHARLRSLQAQTVARLGQAHFDRDDRSCEHFVGLHRSGVPGQAGRARVAVRRP